MQPFLISAPAHSTGPATVDLPFTEPFGWPAMLAFLGPRAFPGIEAVSASHYRRVLLEGGVPVIITATRASRHPFVTLAVNTSAKSVPPIVIERAVRFFDLRNDPKTLKRHLSRDRVLRRALSFRPGIRIPGAWSAFELAVRAIIGQQVSVKAATTFAARLVATYGAPLAAGTDPAGEMVRTFPSPTTLARADLTSIGLIRTRAKWISALASVMVDAPDFFDRLGPLDRAIKELTRLPGIGAWTAHYIAMRALREPDAFPTGDLGLMRAYGQLAGGVVTARELDAVAERWRPWRAYAAMHLWSFDPTAGG